MKSPFGRAAIAATTMLVLAACAGDRPVAPDVGAPAFSVEAANLPLTLSCAWNTVDQTAKALFNSNQDAVFGILSNMRTAHRNGNMTLATSLGFDALREAAIARGGPRIKNSAGGTQADNFTKAVFGCTVHNVIPGDMSVASAWATGGVYAIRGGGDVGAVKSTGTNPKFGAEAPDEWPATRFLIWGFKTTNPFTGEAVTDAFRLETHPTTSFASNPIRVGLCLDPLTNTGAARRLIHGKSTGPTVGA